MDTGRPRLRASEGRQGLSPTSRGIIGYRQGKSKWNSVVNKTPISYSTNREIGGVAPSKYLEKIEKKGQVFPSTLNTYLETHWIEAPLARADDFDQFIIERAKKLLDAIQNATGRIITGRDSEDVIAAFGDKLI